MKRKYIKPSIINYFLLADSARLAGSGPAGAAVDVGENGKDTREDESSGTGSGDGLAKQQYNAWEAWDEF